jgi:putative addiction module component (TIGR02574 family)
MDENAGHACPIESAMPDLLTELSARAQALKPEDRARLAEQLLASLDPHVADVEAAWDLELRHRIAQVEDGCVELIPAAQALAQVRRVLGQ